MEEETEKFGTLSEIYSRFTKENKETLVQTALNLLALQKRDARIRAAVSAPKNER